MSQHEQLYISYGERANSFLLVEYGFAVRFNEYDFFRVNNVQISDFTSEVSPNFDSNLKSLKPVIRADLKQLTLHLDVLALIRANEANEILVLTLYRQWVTTLYKFETTIEEDEELLLLDNEWLFKCILIYRIGQKSILREHLLLCDVVIKALTDNTVEELKYIASASESMRQYFNEL